MSIHIGLTLGPVLMANIKTFADIVVSLCNKHTDSINVNAFIRTFFDLKLLVLAVFKQVPDVFFVDLDELASYQVFDVLVLRGRVDHREDVLK